MEGAPPPLSPGHHHRELVSWPPQLYCRQQTARQLFEELDEDGDGFVAVGDAARRWPRPRRASKDTTGIEQMLRRLALDAGREGQLSWPEFRNVVRLWHAAQGYAPELRPYLLQSAVETSAAVTTTFTVAQAACMACAAVGQSSWLHLAAIGGVGMVITLAPLDASSVRPLLQRASPAPLGLASRWALFGAASASAGVLLAPAVPLLSSTLGDPETHGYGPLAMAGLTTTHFLCQAGLLAVLPERWLPRGEAATAPTGAVLAPALGGGALAAGMGVTVATLVGREGSVRPILLAAGVLSVHAAVIAAAAARRQRRGVPEPLQPTLAPVMQLVRLLVPRVDQA